MLTDNWGNVRNHRRPRYGEEGEGRRPSPLANCSWNNFNRSVVRLHLGSFSFSAWRKIGNSFAVGFPARLLPSDDDTPQNPGGIGFCFFLFFQDLRPWLTELKGRQEDPQSSTSHSIGLLSPTLSLSTWDATGPSHFSGSLDDTRLSRA